MGLMQECFPKYFRTGTEGMKRKETEVGKKGGASMERSKPGRKEKKTTRLKL